MCPLSTDKIHVGEATERSACTTLSYSVWPSLTGQMPCLKSSYFGLFALTFCHLFLGVGIVDEY